MNLKEQIDAMRQIAHAAHHNQFRKDGTTPYIEHVEAVASMVEDRLKPIALGHDLLEDTKVSFEELEQLGFDSYVLVAVDLLTHKHGVPNIEYWKRIATNPDATAVKLADIQHNLSSMPSEHAKEKYVRALAFFRSQGYFA
jgi:(p)ppGpp synthase/HD superfamily hydrolase